VRQVGRNAKYGRKPSMPRRWAGTAMLKAFAGFGRLKADKQLLLVLAARAVRKARAPSSNASLGKTAKA